MPKKQSLLERRKTMFTRAATVLVERILRYDTSVSWSISEIADQGMIRKRWVREACIASPNVKAVPVKGKTRFQYTGHVPYRNPQGQGVDPQLIKQVVAKEKKQAKKKGKKR